MNLEYLGICLQRVVTEKLICGICNELLSSTFEFNFHLSHRISHFWEFALSFGASKTDAWVTKCGVTIWLRVESCYRNGMVCMYIL